MCSDSDARTSVSLLFRIRDYGDEVSWRRFFEQYQPMIEGWCRGRGLLAAEAEEVTSIVLVSLTRSMKTFEYDPKKGFRSWLKTVVVHAVSNHRRGLARRPCVCASGNHEFQTALLEQPADEEDMNELVDKLDHQLEGERLRAADAMRIVQSRVEPHSWQAFWLRKIEDRPGKEVAEQLNMSVAAVHMATKRILDLIRTELARLQDGKA